MLNSHFLEGFTILMKYVKPDGRDLNAHHDTICFGPDIVANVGIEDNQRLRELGWYIHEEAGSWAAQV